MAAVHSVPQALLTTGDDLPPAVEEHPNSFHRGPSPAGLLLVQSGGLAHLSLCRCGCL
jgi:hypothetical protein